MVNHHLLKNLCFWKKHFCNPGSLDSCQKNETHWSSLEGFDVFFLFPAPSAFPTIEKGQIKDHPPGEEKHQIYIPTKLLFLHLSRNRFQKSERIFCWLSKLRHVLGSLAFCHQNWARLQFWYFATRIGQNSNFGILPPKLGKNSIQVKDRKLEMTYLHLHFAYTQFRLFSAPFTDIACSLWEMLSSNHLFSCLLILYLVGQLMLSGSTFSIAIWTNTFGYLDKYVWQFWQIYGSPFYVPVIYSTLTTY